MVDNVVFIGINHLAVFPLLFLAEDDWNDHKLAVFIKQLFNLLLIEEFLAVVTDMENHVTSTPFFLCLADFESRSSVTSPLHGLASFLIRTRDNVDTIAHHET